MISRKLISLTGVLLISCMSAIAQSPGSEGASWQQTLRITGIIEPFDYFGSFDFDDDGERTNIENTYRSLAGSFWHSLRDSIDVAIREDRLNAYSIRPSGRAGQERIFVKDEPVDYNTLINNLDESLRTVANLRAGDVIFLVDRNDVFDIRNYVSDFDNYFENLNAINQFELEFRLTYNESGFSITPTQLILGVAMYPSRFVFEESKMAFFNEYENGLGFLIDLTEEDTMQFFTNSGMQVSGDYNIFPFYDLFMTFNYDYVFYSISGRELAISANEPFNYELERIRKGVMDEIHTLMFQQVYGQVPDYWERAGKGLIINGLD